MQHWEVDCVKDRVRSAKVAEEHDEDKPTDESQCNDSRGHEWLQSLEPKGRERGEKEGERRERRGGRGKENCST